MQIDEHRLIALIRRLRGIQDGRRTQHELTVTQAILNAVTEEIRQSDDRILIALADEARAAPLDMTESYFCEILKVIQARRAPRSTGAY
jgi:hypothetical protein